MLKGKLLAPKLGKSADKWLSQPGCSHSNTIYNLQLQKTIVLRMQPRRQATLTQPLQCDLQPEIPKHPITTHTQPHPKQLAATVTMRQKKRQTDRSRTRRTHEVPFIVACSHFLRKNTRFRAPASSPKHSPCNIMQPFQCDLQAQIPKHPITTHTQAHPKQLEATVTLRQKKNDKPTAAAPAAQTRYLSSPAAATLHGKTQGFVLRLPPQNRTLATSCSHSNAICKHRFQNNL